MLKPKKLAVIIAIMSSTAYFPNYAFADNLADYEFNSGFLVGSKEKIDLKRFNKASIDEGTYSVDVYTNEQWRGRYDLKITRQANGFLGLCYTNKMLKDFGINPSELNKKLSQESNFCGSLEQWNDSHNVKDYFDSSTLKLSISVPQIYILSRSAGYVPSEFWDEGIPAINMSYVANYYDNHYSANQMNDSKSFYLSLNGGVSVNGWLLKHFGNMSWQNSEKMKWNSTQTYIQRPIASMKSNLVLGQFYTESSLFDSIKLRGVKLVTDDNMYPDGASSYAPDINGVALSNALVTVRQNGNIIYQTTVSPGPFSIKDISSIGYGNDLDVTVKEADGSESYFTVPFASISQLLRPGFTHYQMALGQSDDDNVVNKPNILQVSLQHGLNNILTLYSGVTMFSEYGSVLLGSGINTGFGALGLDVTYAHTSLAESSKKGYNYRVTFNRQFNSTNTSFILTASHSSSEGYYDTSEAIHAIDYYRRNVKTSSLSRKNNINMTINQSLSGGYGSFYLTGQIYNYWNDTKTVKQFQQTYSNRIGNLFYSLAFTRSYYENTADNRFSVSFNYPLTIFDKRSTLTSNTLFNNSDFGSTQVGINGAFDQNGMATYGLNSGISTGGKQSLALNTNYRSHLANIGANYSQGDSYRQFGLAANGSLVLHSGGITFTPNTSNTMVLIEADGAEGASIPGSLGTRIDSNGYAIASYARPYRTNTISIDPKGSNDDVTFTNTSSQVVPYEGTVTKVKFETKIEKTLVFNVVDKDGMPMTFGLDVKNADGESIGVVGQGGQVFIYDNIAGNATSALIESVSGTCSFSLENHENKDKVCL